MIAIFDKGAPAPCPEPFNLAAHVLAHAEDLPDKIALAVLSPTGSDRWSYAKLQAAVLGTATGLLQKGFKPGDILLMRLGNTVEFPIAYLAAIAVGLVPVPTSSMLTAPEVAKMVAQLSPAGILHDAGVACPDDTGLPVIDTDELLAMRALPPADYAMGDPNRLAYIIYTSGTSGNPRAVCHAHRAIWARQMMHDGWYGLSRTDRLLHAGAFNWTFTLGTGLMDPWSVGATALIPAKDVPIDAIPLLLKRHDATIFAAAPGVYRKLLNHHGSMDLPKLRHGLAAGEKLSVALRNTWRATTGKEIFEAYGMSECSTFISASPDSPATDGSLGRPQKGRRIAILGPDGPVERGVEGTIAIDRNDPGLMLGYYGAQEETEARFQDGWFMTGDHGAMRDDGQIDYAGRGDDMMNAGGYRVSPLEVETALHHCPGIRDIGVTDVEIKQDTNIIVAFYTADAPLPEDALNAFAQQNLARYKQPRAWVRLDSLPTNPNGKLSRKALKPLFSTAAKQI
ncbi:class I adenylate-forming enzyme family protein [Thalassovita sp.]|uniref:class I adenylate-forming enzyme family protein n=1 Tax=Thalassovita sp. TaxID=1979401 RepID=UPI002B275136|nr:class I adenylate-forming enzyme family protein [Thalassovita sp.]